MLELKYHVQLSSVFTGILFRFLQGNAGCLPNCHDIIFFQNLPVHFLQILMYMRSMCTKRSQVSVHAIYLSIRKRRIFGDKTDNIHPETVHTFF